MPAAIFSPVEESGVTVTTAFSPGAYVALSKATLTVAAVAIEAVTATEPVAVAARIVEASITLRLAVPAAIAVTGQYAFVLSVESTHATGLVADPAISASAAVAA